MTAPQPPAPRADRPADLADRVVAVVAGARGIAPADVRLDATLLELGIDSLDGLELYFDLEEAFDVKIPDEVAREIRTVGDIVDRLSAHLSAGRAGDAP